MFSGSIVALITPLREGRVDEDALRRLVDWQISEGTAGIVPCGTTGEAATLSEKEWERVVATVVDQAAGRAPVIPGTGTNDTAATVSRTRRARELGAAGALVVTPYYNRPSQEGLYQHFSTVAELADLPLVLYNVPGRTGVNLLPETVARLAEHPRIVAIKEASGSLDQASEILASGRPITVLSGDDSLTLPIMSLGGEGVISVLANVVPGPMARLTAAARSGDLATARQVHFELFGLARALFVETNPVPVKTAAAWLGICEGELRLPLAPLGQASEKALFRALRGCRYTAPDLLRDRSGVSGLRSGAYARLGAL